MGDILQPVRDLGNLYGVPEYVWHSIVDMESGGDPFSHNTGTASNPEDSRGLFQINIHANPKYANYDLYDPKVNAEIAFKDFILPAWNSIKGIQLAEGEKAAYVWRYGIKPAWTDKKNEDIMFKASAYASGTTGQIPDNSPDANNTKVDDTGGKIVNGVTDSLNNLANTFTTKTLPSVAFVVAGIVCGVLAVMFLFGNEGGEE